MSQLFPLQTTLKTAWNAITSDSKRVSPTGLGDLVLPRTHLGCSVLFPRIAVPAGAFALPARFAHALPILRMALSTRVCVAEVARDDAVLTHETTTEAGGTAKDALAQGLVCIHLAVQSEKTLWTAPVGLLQMLATRHFAHVAGMLRVALEENIDALRNPNLCASAAASAKLSRSSSSQSKSACASIGDRLNRRLMAAAHAVDFRPPCACTCSYQRWTR